MHADDTVVVNPLRKLSSATAAAVSEQRTQQYF
jgi:hypothetical protein